MAESMYTIIDNGKFEVNHKGETVILNLPDWLCNLSGKLESEEAVLQWAVDNKILHGILHRGIKQLIIDLRACARPTEDVKTGKSLSIINDKDEAQHRIHNYNVKATPKPGSSTTKALNEIIKAMEAVGIPQETIDKTISEYKANK